MKSQQIIEHIAVRSVLSHQKTHQKGNNIHYQQILCNYWYIAHNYKLSYYLIIEYFCNLGAKLLKISVKTSKNKHITLNFQ